MIISRFTNFLFSFFKYYWIKKVRFIFPNLNESFFSSRNIHALRLGTIYTNISIILFITNLLFFRFCFSEPSDWITCAKRSKSAAKRWQPRTERLVLFLRRWSAERKKTSTWMAKIWTIHCKCYATRSVCISGKRKLSPKHNKVLTALFYYRANYDS
jgi:hypothetical protein